MLFGAVKDYRGPRLHIIWDLLYGESCCWRLELVRAISYDQPNGRCRICTRNQGNAHYVAFVKRSMNLETIRST